MVPCHQVKWPLKKQQRALWIIGQLIDTKQTGGKPRQIELFPGGRIVAHYIDRSALGTHYGNTPFDSEVVPRQTVPPEGLNWQAAHLCKLAVVTVRCLPQ